MALCTGPRPLAKQESHALSSELLPPPPPTHTHRYESSKGNFSKPQSMENIQLYDEVTICTEVASDYTFEKTSMMRLYIRT